MDFFQRIGNFFSGKGWVSDEEKRRKEQQVQTQPQNKPAVTFKQDPVLNNLNKTPSFGSPSPTQGLFQQKQETPKTDTVPKVNTVPTANQFTKPIIPEIKPEIPQKTINDAPKVLTPQGQQDWVNKENKQIQTQNLVNKPIITPKKPTYFDYANPFGEHGLFGAKQQQNFKQIIEKPITDNVNKFNNWIDSSDKEKGFQWNSPGDYLRFGAKIPGGMIQGLAEAPNKMANAITGIESDENGKVKQLNGVQRFGKGLDAGISVGGLGFGGSGTLLRSLAGKATGNVLKGGAKQGIGRAVFNGAKNLVKDSAKEGAEEVVQTFSQDLADDGKINMDKNAYIQSGAFGALGGGMMHGAGKLAQGVHNSYNNHVNNAIANHVAGYMVNPYATSRRSAAQTNLVNAINNKTDSPVDFGTLSKKKFNQVNELLSTNGQPVLESRNIKVHPAVVDKLIQKRVGLDGMTPQQVADVAYSAVHARNSRVIPSRYPHIAAFTKAQTDRAVPFATLAGYNGEVSLKSAYKKPLANSLADVERNVVSGESAQITPSEDARLAPNNRSIEVADRQLADNFTGATTDYSVANNSRNVNEDVKYKLNPEHEAQVRAYNEHITRLRQREEYLRGQGMSENAPAMINLRKAQEQAIYARDHIGEVDENGLKYKLSPEQETFFKDSKIRDENGNLKTVYHGTNSEFDQFSPLAGSSSSTRNRWGEGNYLAYDKDMANGYGVNLKEMYANITSPITNNQKTVSFDQYDALHRRVNNGEPAYREDYDMYDNDMDLLWDITDNGQWKKYAQDIKDTTGKDGVIMDDMAITFSPNQTKYTNNLNPTDSPDMRFKIVPNGANLYHGSPHKFNKFSTDNIGSGEGNQSFGWGLYFTDNKGIAEHYADIGNTVNHAHMKNAGDSRNLYNINLTSSDGHDFDFLSWYDAVGPEQQHKIKQQALVENLTDRWGASVRDVERYPNSIPFSTGESGADMYHKLQSEWSMTPKEASMFLSRAGVDGIIYPADSKFNANNQDLSKAESVNYVVFDENNIKVQDYVKFKRQEAHAQKLISSMQRESELLARHLQLTGDENLVFNEWQNEMQKKALGYYDPKTDQINLNKLTEDTLNHELGHKLLTRVENKQDLLNSIRESYGDEYLINKYGSQYGNDLNLLAEEQLADGFSDYYNGRLNGEGKVRLGTRLGIPQKVLAIYDRITEAIMGLVGKQDAIKQFYAQMETGKFRNEVFGNTEQLPAYKKSDKFQHPLQETINEMEANPKPRMTRELRDAIDEFIYENIDPKLFLEHNDTNILGSHGLTWSIPRLHVDDLRHYLGKELAGDLPSNYKRRTGKRDIDTVAQEMGYDDIDTFIDEIKRVAEARRAERERKTLLAEWRRDPDVIEEAQKMIAERHAEEVPKIVKPPTNAERVSSIDPADINTNNYVNDLVKEQKLARKGEQPTLKERWQDFKADMREKFVDRFAPIEDKIKNQSEQLEMRNALDRTLRADGISEAFIRDNNFDKLITSFKNKKELQTFEQALIAKHALELESNGVETGRDLAGDKALIKATNKRFAKEFKQVREYSDKVLQQTVDYGLISQDTANYLRKKYPDYIPFDRIFSDKEINTQMKHGVGVGEASLSTQSIIQRIEGSSRLIDSPLNALITKTQDMVRQGERNKTAELLASYAKDPKNPFQLRELKPDESADGRPTISYLDNGKKRTFLAAPEVAKAAKNMNREQMNIVLRALATPARVLRMGATTVNAGFTMANVVKDFVGATINSKGGINSMNPKTLAEAIGAGFHHKGDLYLEMQREGVVGNSYEILRNASELNLNEIRSHKNLATRALHNLKSPLRTLENTIGRSEDIGRAIQYVSNKKYAKRKGMSESEAVKFAADQARWNSTNFARSGTYGKTINAVVPYSNANIQGQRITLRRMKENPVRYTAKITMGVVAPTIAVLAWNYADEDRKKVMENIPDYVKENNVVVVGRNAKYNKEQNKWEGVYLVPVPPQFSPLHRQLNNMVASTMAGKKFDMVKAGGDTVEQITTVNPTELRRTGAQYIPQAAKPLVELFANKNLFTGQEIVPEAMKNLEQKDQWDSSTSLTARKVGELTGLSPKQIDNAFRTSTAGGGQNLLHGADFALAKATGASNDEIKGRSMLDSIVGRFYAPKGTSQSSYFYQSLEKASKDNKLVGDDLAYFKALTTRKYNGDGSVEGKTDADVLMTNRTLANKPNIAKALSDAAKWRSEQTGEELDPLYKLSPDKQQYFYHIQGSPKNSAEQRKLKQDAPWLEDFQKERSAYFKRQDFKSGKSNRVPYPEVSDELQATLKTYHDMPSSPQKWAFLDAHPELSDHFKQIEDYNNKVREAQGYAPLRTRPQQSQYVKMQMANKNWRDPAVAKYLQDVNVYNITNSASLAEMQGEELSPKALKAIQSVGKYGLVKNPDGTFALKYPDGQGTNESHIQAGAIDMSSFGRRRGGRSGSSNGTRTSTDTLKLSNATALGMNTFKKNKGGLPQFSVKAIQKSGLLKSRRPTSRVVTFR